MDTTASPLSAPLLAPPPMDKTALLGGDARPMAPHPGRWWMLCWLSLLCAAQGWVWNTFGPLSQAVEPMYGWSDGVIATMSAPLTTTTRHPHSPGA